MKSNDHEIDTQIARDVLCWTRYSGSNDLWWSQGEEESLIKRYTGPSHVTPRTPHRSFRPSRKKSDALEALEYAAKKYGWASWAIDGCGDYEVTIYKDPYGEYCLDSIVSEKGKSLARTICLALIRAVEA